MKPDKYRMNRKHVMLVYCIHTTSYCSLFSFLLLLGVATSTASLTKMLNIKTTWLWPIWCLVDKFIHDDFTSWCIVKHMCVVYELAVVTIAVKHNSMPWSWANSPPWIIVGSCVVGSLSYNHKIITTFHRKYWYLLN